MRSGQVLNILIDTGSNRNYIQPKFVPNPLKNKNPFQAVSVGGNIKITHYKLANLFNDPNTIVKFFLLPTLKTFDAILGSDSLKELGAVIDIKNKLMLLKNGMSVPIQEKKFESVNVIIPRTEHLTESQKTNLSQLVKKYPNLFAEPNEKLTYITRVKAEIRINTDTPVYSKFYPFPFALKDEVNKQINELLENEIIRPSRSPYNSPVWIVPKKLDASNIKKYRMVIDYRKLNSVTIADKYPIPDINTVLAQLGNNKLYSVLDLKSGFHQIQLKESDIEKTAFSINNGKYEFTRLPFGLKNAPSIFQRALDDILREHIGKICYIYIDDIIVFSQDEETHCKNLDLIFDTLNAANIKCQLDKCEFFKNKVEFLGFVISDKGIETNPAKVEAIANYPQPKTVKELRAFLGLSSYYRRFIMGYAALARPLTALLRGEDGRISKSASARKQIQFNDEAIKAFEKIKSTLISDDVILQYPDFNKEFVLTTDASDYAIGAVLSQNDRPISFISRTLSETEENYETAKKEMLAICWAVKTFKGYLYGGTKVKIYTDHEPLTHDCNWKGGIAIRRWKTYLDEYNKELLYKPGKENVVADALSRAPKRNQINSIASTQHSAQSSSQNLIPSIEVPINAFKNQIFIHKEHPPDYKFIIPFPTFHRHIISQQTFSEVDLLKLLQKYLNPTVINGIYTTEDIMGQIQKLYPEHFQSLKIRFTQTKVIDLNSEAEQDEKILQTHNRAHRNAQENKIQIAQKYYFPKMKQKIATLIKQCQVCKEVKYDRHPPNPEIAETPIPEYPGHTIHIDIFSTERKLVLTAIDKFSKLACAKIINSKSIEDIKKPLHDILFYYGVPKFIVMDNEKSFNSASITFMLKDQLGIEIYKAPPYKSSVNGQIERFHSTLAETMRCLKAKQVHRTFEELLDRSVYEYNYSIHSVTKQRPLDVFFGRHLTTDPEQYEKSRQNNIEKLKQKQMADLQNHNKERNEIINYQPGQEIFVKQNTRLGSKLTPRFKKEIVKENRNTTIVTDAGRVVHKSNIKSH